MVDLKQSVDDLNGEKFFSVLFDNLFNIWDFLLDKEI